jgi:CheY-like chemotaxis protein
MVKKILVIDDEELLTKTFVKVLEKIRYDVFIAKRGQDACEMAGEESFDLIISDIKMPGFDGVETVLKLKEIFKQKKFKIPPIIFITGFADEAREKEARKLKPVAYLMKPFDIQDLLQAVSTALGDENK